MTTSIYINDQVANVSVKTMLNVITGQGGNTLWASPNEWRHFRDNIRIMVPAQALNIDNIALPYQIQ